MLDGGQHAGYGICRIISFVDGVGVFFLYDVVHLGRVRLARGEEVGKAPEEFLGLVVYRVRIVVCDHVPAHMGGVQYGVLLKDEAVQLLAV